MKIRSKATLTLRPCWPEDTGLGRAPTSRLCATCGHRGIACHLAEPPESPQKQEKRRPFLLDLRFSGFL